MGFLSVAILKLEVGIDGRLLLGHHLEGFTVRMPVSRLKLITHTAHLSAHTSSCEKKKLEHQMRSGSSET